MSAFQFSFLVILFFAATTISFAEIRITNIRSDDRGVISLDEFGFTHTGRLELNVSHISIINSTIHKPELSQLGFFLITRHSWAHAIKQLREAEVLCILNSNLIKSVFRFDNLTAGQFHTSFEVNDFNQYALFFADCAMDIQVSMDVRSAMYNVNPKTGQRVYLSSGKTSLPSLYFFPFLVYLWLASFWSYTIYDKLLSVFRVHFFMLAVVILKALNLLCEAEDQSYIARTGTSHGWDIMFYVFSIWKGIMLFTVIVLIGSGWSFIKPYLQDKEKGVLMIVIPLQVIANVAQIVIDESTPFAEYAYAWKKVFLFVDIICCCAVLFPIAWSMKKLHEAARIDGKAAVNLMKMTLFRNYYLVVIFYIYFTRLQVYVLETITSPRYEWTSVLAAEVGTLIFYIFTGCIFRPKPHNLYFAIDDEEDEAALESIKIDEEF